MSNNGAHLGFEQKLWKAADKLRSNVDAAEYKHVVLGSIFLSHLWELYFNPIIACLRPVSAPFTSGFPQS